MLVTESGNEVRSVTTVHNLLSSTLHDVYPGDSGANWILMHTIEWGGVQGWICDQHRSRRQCAILGGQTFSKGKRIANKRWKIEPALDEQGRLE